MEKFFTTEQVGGIVRAVGGTFAAYAVGKGWIVAGDAEWIVGGLVTVVVSVWSWWAKKPS